MVCLFLSIMVWAVFGQTRHYGFVFDDSMLVNDNPHVVNGLTIDGVLWAFNHSHGGHWIPLTVISHMVDCQIWGLNAGGHHLTNVLLHMATVVLLFLTLRKMTGAFWRSAVVAAVFAIHPLRVESVAWVSERKDVLSGLFFMLTLWAYTRHAQRQPPPSATGFLRSPEYWLTFTCFALGLMSKPMLVTLPLILLLLDYWPLKRFASSGGAINGKHQNPVLLRLIYEKIPLLGLILVVGVILFITSANQHTMGGAFYASLEAHHDLSTAFLYLNPLTRTSHALLTPMVYLWQMFCPVDLVVFSPPAKSLPGLEVGLVGILLVAVSIAVWAWRQKLAFLLTGWCWYLVMLAPILLLIQRGMEIRCDRYTYLPQIGLYIMAVWWIADLCDKRWYLRIVLGLSTVIILTALTIQAHQQTRYWKNNFSIWTHALSCNAENYVAHDSLGIALAEQGKIELAIQHYRAALNLNQDYNLAQMNLGNALASQGKLVEAIPYFQNAIRIDPNYPEAHVNLGNALASQGKLAEAIPLFEHALELNPDFAEAHLNLGNALARQGNLAGATLHLSHALQLKPDSAMASFNLGNILASQGKLDEAVIYYERSLLSQPDYAEASANLGIALAAQGKWITAKTQMQQALKLALTQNKSALADFIRNQLKEFPKSSP